MLPSGLLAEVPFAFALVFLQRRRKRAFHLRRLYQRRRLI